MLVAVGAAVFVLVPQQMQMPDAELSRVIQGVITGVGFLGAGTILKRTSEETVKGLTTAGRIMVDSGYWHCCRTWARRFCCIEYTSCISHPAISHPAFGA